VGILLGEGAEASLSAPLPVLAVVDVLLDEGAAESQSAMRFDIKFYKNIFLII
jgi:hypothetical protein